MTNGREWTDLEKNHLFGELVGFYPIDLIVLHFNNFCKKNNLPERSREAIITKIYRSDYSRRPVYNYISLSLLASILNYNVSTVLHWSRYGIIKHTVQNRKVARVDLGLLKKLANERPELFACAKEEILLWLFDNDTELVKKCLSEESFNKCSSKNKPVQCIDDKNRIVRYPNIREASKEVYLSEVTIKRCIRLNKKDSLGRTWKYIKPN